MDINYKASKHIHTEESMGEYISTGDNLLGQEVTCKMEKTACIGCLSESVRLIKSLA